MAFLLTFPTFSVNKIYSKSKNCKGAKLLDLFFFDNVFLNLELRTFSLLILNYLSKSVVWKLISHNFFSGFSSFFIFFSIKREEGEKNWRDKNSRIGIISSRISFVIVIRSHGWIRDEEKPASAICERTPRLVGTSYTSYTSQK